MRPVAPPLAALALAALLSGCSSATPRLVDQSIAAQEGLFMGLSMADAIVTAEESQRLLLKFHAEDVARDNAAFRAKYSRAVQQFGGQHISTADLATLLEASWADKSHIDRRAATQLRSINGLVAKQRANAQDMGALIEARKRQHQIEAQLAGEDAARWVALSANVASHLDEFAEQKRANLAAPPLDAGPPEAHHEPAPAPLPEPTPAAP